MTSEKYTDILYHQPVRPKRHTQLPANARAAQFAPFAALK